MATPIRIWADDVHMLPVGILSKCDKSHNRQFPLYLRD